MSQLRAQLRVPILITLLACTTGAPMVTVTPGLVGHMGGIEAMKRMEHPQLQPLHLIEETTTISRNMERLQGLGFRIQSSPDHPVSVYTVHYLPGVPKRLEGTELDGSDFEGRRPEDAVSGLSTPPVEVSGERYFYWHLDPGDPLGDYRIEVYVNDRLHDTLVFTVIE